MSTSSVGRPGKYQRSAGGLVAALVITVVGVGGLLWVLGLFRPDLDDAAGRDRLPGFVGDAQDAGLEPVYPVSLPDGWSPPATRSSRARRRLGDRTADRGRRGLRRHPAGRRVSAPTWCGTYVDDEATPRDIYSSSGSVVEAWQGYEDEGGDTAYAAEVGDQTVLVYGSASPEELQDLIDRLTTEPVG